MNYQSPQDEEMLTRELQSLATEMNKLSAPDSVEAKVLEAFRARKVVPITAKRPNSHYWLAAIAAMLLIAMSVVALRWRSNVETPRREVAKQQSPDKPKSEPNTPQPINELPKEVEYQAVSEPPKRKPVRNQRARRSENLPVANHAREIATDFIPLVAAPHFSDSEQLVRIKISRSALLQVGLPMNETRSDEPIEADVLLGIDGMPQAIPDCVGITTS